MYDEKAIIGYNKPWALLNGESDLDIHVRGEELTGQGVPSLAAHHELYTVILLYYSALCLPAVLLTTLVLVFMHFLRSTSGSACPSH